MNTGSSADAHALSLFATLASVADPSVRIAYLRSEWVPGRPETVAEVLEVAAAGADAGLVTFRQGLLELVVALAPAEFESIRKDAARHAIARGLGAARSLLVPESVEHPANASTLAPRPTPGKTVTLGERKSLARRHGPTTIDKVVSDPHPDVIRILLSNPTLRESDVLRIASRRPVPGEVLREILVHPRRLVRYTIRFALLQNPYLPTTLGAALVRGLRRQDAASIVASTELPETIRAIARADLARPPLH